MSPAVSDALLGLAIAIACGGALLLIFGCAMALVDYLDQRADFRERQAKIDDLNRMLCGYGSSPCRPGDHDWMLPTDGRDGYCLRCGASFPPGAPDPRRAETAVIEAKADNGSR